MEIRNSSAEKILRRYPVFNGTRESSSVASRWALRELFVPAADGVRSRFGFLPLPAFGNGSEISEISASARSAMRRIRTAEWGVGRPLSIILDQVDDGVTGELRCDPCHCARQHSFRKMGQVCFLADLGVHHVLENSCGRRDRPVCRLNGRCAPVLEQKRNVGSSGRAGFHGGVRPGSGMGLEEARHMALKTAKKKSGPVSQNAFAGQSDRPTQKAVESVLGQSCALWKQLVTELKQDLHLDGEDWHSSGVKYGWALRLRLKDRNIVYLGPRVGSFMASFVLGDKAVAAAHKSELPAYVLKMIAEAKRYGEGTPVRIEVSRPEDLNPVKMLARIKVAN